MTLKAMERAMEDLFNMAKAMVEKYNHDVREEYRQMTDRMDGMVQAAIFCRKDNFWEKVQALQFKYQDKFMNEVWL